MSLPPPAHDDKSLCLGAGLAALWLPDTAWAHASNQSFVLLLPLDLYIASGVASVALTVLILALAPGKKVAALYGALRLWPLRLRAPGAARGVVQGLSLAALLAGIWMGWRGPRDPLANLLPLGVWTAWWIALVSVQGIWGGLWRWVNPWPAAAWLLRRVARRRALWRYPAWLAQWPACVLFLSFAVVLLADPAPADPARLAGLVAGYTGLTLLGGIAFGRRWLVGAEFVTVLMRTYGQLGLWRRGRLGLQGWVILQGLRPGPARAVFALLILGTGSFDGLNETFWWLGLIGVNPLEFPGRSAVIEETVLGLLAVNAVLIAVFAACLWGGLRLAGGGVGPGQAFCIFAPTMLPIALGYHIAHYLPSFLVDAQYLIAAMSDPMARGADILGLGTFYVTTGFFNTQDSVRLIWLTQAAAVVLGHMLSILLAHGVGVRYLGTARAAALAQAPLAAFMIAYTFFGLWLLASPRG